MTAAEAIQKLNLRIRGEAHTEQFLLDLLGRSQQIVNGVSQTILEEITLETAPYQQIYDLPSRIPRLFEVLSVRDESGDLDKIVNWKELAYRDRRWFRRVGNNFESYTVMGRDVLVIHPAKIEVSAVTVVYVRLTDLFETNADDLELPDDLVPTVVDIAEIICLMRERRFDSVPMLVKRLAGQLGVPTDDKSQRSAVGG